MGFISDTISSISGGASSILGAGLGLVGGLFGNEASAEQAHKQREFQRAMSNTAYQRAAKDMEKAGLNRILAVGSPASTPGGAMGQVQNLADAAAKGAGTAMAVRTAKANVEQMESSATMAKVQQKIDSDMLRLYEKNKPFRDAVLAGRLAREGGVGSLTATGAAGAAGANSAWQKFKDWTSKRFENYGERNSAKLYRQMNKNVQEDLRQLRQKGEYIRNGIRVYKDARGRTRFEAIPEDPNWEDKLPILD